MSDFSFHPGAKVTWRTANGLGVGVIERQATQRLLIGALDVAASQERPLFIVRCAKTGAFLALPERALSLQKPQRDPGAKIVAFARRFLAPLYGAALLDNVLAAAAAVL